MTADNERDRGPGGSRREDDADPAYQGAKPGAFTLEGAGIGFGAGLDERGGDECAAGAQLVGDRAARCLCHHLRRHRVLLPGVTLAALVLLFAAYMLVDGVLALVAGLRAAERHERWGWLALEGVADLVAGVIAFVWPLVTVLAFVYLMGVWAIVSGALLLSASCSCHKGLFIRAGRREAGGCHTVSPNRRPG